MIPGFARPRADLLGEAGDLATEYRLLTRLEHAPDAGEDVLPRLLSVCIRMGQAPARIVRFGVAIRETEKPELIEACYETLSTRDEEIELLKKQVALMMAGQPDVSGQTVEVVPEPVSVDVDEMVVDPKLVGADEEA